MQTNGRASHVPVIPVIPIGTIKSFGPFGPRYEVGRALRQLDDGDWMIKVKMVQSGEKSGISSHAPDEGQRSRLMFAIAFDLVVADTELRHPRGVSQAYTDIGSILADHGFAAHTRQPLRQCQ